MDREDPRRLTESLQRALVRVRDQAAGWGGPPQPAGSSTSRDDKLVPGRAGELVRLAGRPRSAFSPRLAYGRHRGPARQRCRRAAVVAAIYPRRESGQLCLTLTRRPTFLSHHGGQVCLPGGRIEPGESAATAAVREYREELGVALEITAWLGTLDPMYVFASDNRVEAWVVTAETPASPWRPDPSEVAEVIEMPLGALAELGRRLHRTPAPSVAGRQRSPVAVAGPPASATPTLHGTPHGAPHGAPHGNSLSGPSGVSSGGPSGGQLRRQLGGPFDEQHLAIVPRTAERAGVAFRGGRPFSFEFGYPAIRFVDCAGTRCEVWGATAMLLGELAEWLDQALAVETV
jgi:8-oxo-dGTP pyrophosphatase MutT (NUDIX family)